MYISIDVGSTNTRIGGSSDLKTLIDPDIEPTPRLYEKGVEGIVRRVQKLASGEPIDMVAIGLPGSLAPDRRSLHMARNIPDWNGRPFADDIEKALSTLVSLENDTMQVGHGEAVFGAGIGARIVVYMTVSTGVNAVRIVEGKIEPSVYGYETGFQYLSMGEKPQDLMDLISGAAISARFGVGSPKELGKDHPVWEELARTTAFGIHNTILHWSPHRIVLGGSMFNEIGIPVERVDYHLKDIMKIFPSTPEIVHSSLGDIGGLYGGLARLKQLV